MIASGALPLNPKSSLGGEQAVRRLQEIVPYLVADVRLATETKETLEEGNRIVPPGLKGVVLKGVGGYNVIYRSLTYNLVLDLARIFDASAGRSLDSQDKASIPVVAHLLAKSEVRSLLIEQARGWPGPEKEQAEGCERSIDRVLTLWSQAQSGAGADRLKRLRDFRTMRLAHSLFDREPSALPIYNDLFELLAIAEPICEAVSLCVLGDNIHVSYTREDARSEATAFWTQVLDGLRPSRTP